MTEHQFRISYYRCGSCDAKNRCYECERTILETMRKLPLEAPFVSMEQKKLAFRAEEEEAEHILDALDANGIFID